MEKKDTSNNFDVKKDIKVFRTSRNLPPADFIFKIQSFSSLLDSSLLGWSSKRLQSRSFDSGSHKWRLSSRKSEKEDGDDHISLYLSLADIDKLPSRFEVYAKVNFFLFNQIKNKYLCVQDGKVWHFHRLRKEWGIDQLLPLSTFIDPSNGYLIDDCCTFGVEITVRRAYDNATFELFDLSKTLKSHTFTWKIKDYKSKKTIDLCSPEFIIGGWKWKLCLYPKGHHGEDGKNIALYLNSVDSHDDSELEAIYKLRIKDQVSGGSKELQTNAKFCSALTSWGFSTFMPLKDLKDKPKRFIHDDSLIVEVEFSYLSVIRIT